MPTPIDPETVARALHARDAAASTFGIELVTAGPEGAVARMAVTPQLCNGVGVLHGGVTFALADSAMAFASNSDNVVALASSAQIDWLRPVSAGDVITAIAERRWGSGRSTVWDVTVTNGAGEQVALLRGRTHKIARPVIE